MNYALVKDGAVTGYPYSVSQLRRDNPQTSFPSSPSEALLAEFGVVSVAETPRPDCDPLTQDVVEGTPVNVDGKWQRVWNVVDVGKEEVEARKARELDLVRSYRAEAYRNEADPIFFKAQRGEADMAEWQAKVQEIRDRYPYPEWAQAE